uniref:C2H2-type domain-containing protein n=1 Tax=Biomphalaria glabrata TaxID=6526 RepID=A0A2C9K9U6_BIOGL
MPGGHVGYLLNLEAPNQKTIMADMECDFTLDLKHEMKQEKEEINKQNLIKFPCEKLEQVSQIKIEKTEWVGLKTQSSENHCEFSQVNKNLVTKANKPKCLALRLLLSSEMSNSSLHPVPVIRPNLKSEVSVSDVQEMKEINLQKEVEPSNINQFVKSWHLEEPKKAHIGKKPFKCLVCQKELSFYSGIREHLLLHTFEKLLKYKCDMCQKKFSRFSLIQSHIPVHTGEKSFKCQICLKTFTLFTNLKNTY